MLQYYVWNIKSNHTTGFKTKTKALSAGKKLSSQNIKFEVWEVNTETGESKVILSSGGQ